MQYKSPDSNPCKFEQIKGFETSVIWQFGWIFWGRIVNKIEVSEIKSAKLLT